MKRTQRILTISLTTILIAAALLLGGAWYLISYALLPDPQRTDTRLAYERLYDHVPDMRQWVDSVKQCHALRDTTITIDGRRAHALYLHTPDAHGRTAIVVHGYRNTAQTFLYLGRMYADSLHFNILLPDLYAHGLSDGDNVQMGWRDRLDVMRWTEVAHSLFASKDDSVKMVVHGVSMGAATVMCLSGEEKLPPYVNCLIEDCGYTATAEELGVQLSEQFHLPQQPLIPLASALCQWRFGWSFADGSPLQQVRKCHRPMLFIHGSNDSFVPTRFVHELHQAKPQPKQLWIAPGSAHAHSYIDHPAAYTATVRQFLQQWMENK